MKLNKLYAAIDLHSATSVIGWMSVKGKMLANDQQKQKGQRHHTILRGLAYKWIRIVHRCWQTGQHYDEDRYLAALTKRQSTLITIIKELAELPENQEASP